MLTHQRAARLGVLMERHNRRCFWCEGIVQRVKVRRHARPPKDQATEDHIVPASNGGTDDMDNLVLACWRCNTDRGNKPAAVFLAETAHRRTRPPQFPNPAPGGSGQRQETENGRKDQDQEL